MRTARKIKLYGSPKPKELKKKHSSRPVGGMETGNQGGEDAQGGGGWRARVGKAAMGSPSSPTFACV